jgi:ligand-binding sensor domain-containing protein
VPAKVRWSVPFSKNTSIDLFYISIAISAYKTFKLSYVVDSFYIGIQMRALILRIILILITSGKLGAQENQHTFHNLNEKDGLVENLVFCLLKDSRGILWVGTQNGLSRFDGSHFYNFKRTRDKNSLPHNAIECLTEDSNGNIWGGTDNGIFRYSPSINKFDIFQSPSNAVDNVIHNITCDKTGAIYATTTFSLIKLDAHKQSFVNVIQRPALL